jgi:nicotinamidase-related amidase
MKTQTIEASKTAIVLIETQHDFLKPGGSMYPSIAGQLEERRVIPNLVDLVKEARKKVKKIVYAPSRHSSRGSRRSIGMARGCLDSADWKSACPRGKN